MFSELLKYDPGPSIGQDAVFYRALILELTIDHMS